MEKLIKEESIITSKGKEYERKEFSDETAQWLNSSFPELGWNKNFILERLYQKRFNKSVKTIKKQSIDYDLYNFFFNERMNDIDYELKIKIRQIMNHQIELMLPLNLGDINIVLNIDGTFQVVELR